MHLGALPLFAACCQPAKLDAFHNVTAVSGNNAIGAYNGGEVRTEPSFVASFCDFSCPAPIALQGIAAAKLPFGYG